MELPYDDNSKLYSYAWPGGYPIFYVDGEDSVLCPHCANENLKNAIKLYRPVTWGINYESEYMTCDECSESIDCAYSN